MTNKIKGSIFIVVWFTMAVGMIMLSCSTHESNQTTSSVRKEQAKTGKELVGQYCGTCHMPLTADLLDKRTWEKSILPIMGKKLGVNRFRGEYFIDPASENKSSITLAEWKKIVAYFSSEAPDSLIPAKPTVPLKHDWGIFKIKLPPRQSRDQGKVATFMVTMDTANQRIYSSDAQNNKLYVWDKNLNRKLAQTLSSPAVNLQFTPNRNNGDYGVITTIGTTRAADISRGNVLRVHLNGGNSTISDTIASKIDRPVMSVNGDFNKDGLMDWVVCGFGHDNGGLYLYQQNPDHSYTRKIIFGLPGAIEAKVDDFNGDGWPDLMVLFAYADEGIWLFLNDQHGNFSTKNLLRFPPVYGSTSFQLVDMNNDGRRDILYTNGDNADFSQILKPYHGVRIFLNRGNFKYEKAYFYHIDGTTKAIAKDFDGDGDLDIATISFFSDFKHKPSESFIYFEQTGPMKFIPHALPIFKEGRWLTMDAGDIDKDGDIDLVLGSFTESYVNQNDYPSQWGSGSPLILLLNTSK